MAKIKTYPYTEHVWRLIPHDESPVAPSEVDAKTLKWINDTLSEFDEVQLFLEKLYKGV